ncbi:MAG: WD40 repeat domain-containing serine/threonine protein kinase [Hyalangium sp.]|uniref:WD40 repeat domain-containing serine/threonine protein kinase n=1 Tax=Hyalangium sp. TaxID=2028555 RepID=UPI00389A1C2E
MSQDDATMSLPAARKAHSSAGPEPAASSSTVQALSQADLNRYDLGGEFAHGAIGRILRAKDRRLDRPVAIKELLTQGGDMEARFVAEAFITARLQHPSIVPIYDAGRWTTGEPFYAMKLVSGRSLADVIAEKKTLQERLALLPHVLAVAEAIAYAHSERIIHRDLKPANVLVGAFGETVVVDWGLAKDLSMSGDPERAVVSSKVSTDSSSTQRGMVMGTPAYMPPEQASGDPVDERADVYALGAILYHLLAGQKPYGAGTPTQVIEKVVQGPPMALSHLQKGIPADLLAIVAKAMARKASERYATARELAEDLRRFATGQIVNAHVYSLGERFWRFIRRYRAAVAVTAVALLVLLGVGTASLLSIVAARDHAERKQAEAEAAQRDAESARQQTLERADELTLLNARAAVDRDPNEAIAWLRSLSPGFPRWSAVRTIAADARAHGFATILKGHTQTINELAFTPDGKQLITSSDDHTVRVWDLEHGGARVLAGHTDEVWRLELSPDGRSLATASKDRTVRLWNLETGESRWLASHLGPVNGIGFTPDGRHLVSICGGDDLLRIWDVATGALVRTHKTGLGRLFRLGLSMDGRYALVRARMAPRAQLWDLEQGTSRTLEHDGTITAGAISPRGDLAATGALDQTVRVWDMRTGKGRILGEKLGAISYMAFSPDGGQLAAGSAEGQLWLWNLKTGQSELLGSHEGRINQIHFSRDGRLLATSSDDRTARLWDLSSGHNRILRGPQAAAFPLDFSPDGRWLAVGSYDATTRLFAVTTEANRLITKTPVALDALKASPEGRRLAISGADGALRLVDVATGNATVLEKSGAGEGAPRQFSPDGRWLATGGKDGRVRLWNVLTGQLERQMEGHSGVLTALAFAHSGGVLASADSKGEVRIWELGGGQPRSLGNQGDAVLKLSFSPDDQRLASGGKSGVIRLWELATGGSQELRGHEDEVNHLLFFPEGKRLVSGSMDHSLRIWDLASGASQRVDTGGSGVLQLLVTSDGKLMISSSANDSSLRLWDGLTGAPRGMLSGHQGEITDMVLSPDGRRLASASPDRTVRLWDLATSESRVLRGHTGWVTGVVFLDDQHLASISWDGTVRLWLDDLPTDPAALRAWMATIDGSQ